MSDYLEAGAAARVPGMACEYGLDEVGTLQLLVDVCDDAADGATRLAELFDMDNASETAEAFRHIAAERNAFAVRLRQMLEDRYAEASSPVEGTFRAKLFRWRLQIARQLPVGHRDIDDHRALLGIARQGSSEMMAAYAAAEGRLAGCESQPEVHREAEAVRVTNWLISRIAA